MLNNKYIELVNKNIDGIITDAEKQELENLLSTNAEVREYHENLKDTLGLLDFNANSAVDPSPNLKKKIFNTIDPHLYSTSKNNNFKIPSFKNIIGKLNPKLAISFTAGLVSGLILFSIIFSNINISSGNKIDYTGTIGLIDNTNAKILSTVPVDISGLSGEITLYNMNKYYWLDIDVNALDKYDFKLLFYHPDIYFDNISPLSSPDFKFIHGNNFIKLSGLSSSHYYLFLTKMTDKLTEMSFEISVEGKTVLSKELNVK